MSPALAAFTARGTFAESTTAGLFRVQAAADSGPSGTAVLDVEPLLAPFPLVHPLRIPATAAPTANVAPTRNPRRRAGALVAPISAACGAQLLTASHREASPSAGAPSSALRSNRPLEDAPALSPSSYSTQLGGRAQASRAVLASARRRRGKDFGKEPPVSGTDGSRARRPDIPSDQARRDTTTRHRHPQALSSTVHTSQSSGLVYPIASMSVSSECRWSGMTRCPERPLTWASRVACAPGGKRGREVRARLSVFDGARSVQTGGADARADER